MVADKLPRWRRCRAYMYRSSRSRWHSRYTYICKVFPL